MHLSRILITAAALSLPLSASAASVEMRHNGAGEACQGDAGKKGAKLLVYDLDLKEVAQIELEPGLSNTGHMLPVSDTRFLGWYGNPAGTHTTLYLYDLAASKKLRSSKVEVSPVWVSERRVDRSFWMLAAGRLSRVDPETLEIKPVGRLERDLDLPVTPKGRTSHRGHPSWIGKELYGTANGSLLKSERVE